MSVLVGDLSATMKINKISENVSVVSFYYTNYIPTIIFSIAKHIVIVNSKVFLKSDLTL